VQLIVSKEKRRYHVISALLHQTTPCYYTLPVETFQQAMQTTNLSESFNSSEISLSHYSSHTSSLQIIR